MKAPPASLSHVYKYPLAYADEQTLELPAWAQPLHVAEQNGGLILWALVRPDNPPTPRVFRIAGTGHPLDVDPSRLRHIATVLVHGGVLVWHVFEVRP